MDFNLKNLCDFLVDLKTMVTVQNPFGFNNQLSCKTEN